MEVREGKNGCVCYLKGRERGTDSVGVCVSYIKGKERGTEMVCVCRLCERERRKE